MTWIRRFMRELTKTHMPLDLLDIRHGESEGNKYKRMDPADVPPEFCNKPSFYYRLTDDGIARAILVGKWLRDYIKVDRVLYSPYSRAEETAYYLGIDAPHRLRYEIRERGYGDQDRPALTASEEACRIERIRGRKVDPMLWYPDNGETMIDVMMRYYLLYGTLHREHSHHVVGTIMHGESMMGNAAQIHRWAPEDLKLQVHAKNPLVDIENCQINHWSRRNPHNGKVHSHLEWVRVIRPWDPDFHFDWQPIERADRKREDLPMLFEQHERLIA